MGRTIGIIGGMGPGATCTLFQYITARIPARRDQDHLHVIINSDPSTPDRTAAIVGDGDSPLPWLVRSARLLESVGATVLAIPCVTAHAYLDGLRSSVSVKVLSIVEETRDLLQRAYPHLRCLGFLATDGALRADIAAPLRMTYRVLTPSQHEQCNVMAAIYGPFGIKTRGVNTTASSLLNGAARCLVTRGAEVIVAACTEIPLGLRPKDVSVPLVDTLEVLADALIREGRRCQINSV